MKSDHQLQQDVAAELEWEPSVNAARIGVSAREGVVSLGGEVATFSEKWNAERAALRVSGVKALTVDIEVKLAGAVRRSDADIAQSAQNALEWSSALPLQAVKVMVEGGWVTLSGEVDWQYQRQAAVESIRYLLGVRGVSDQIGISSKASTSAVKSVIEAALKRRAASEASEISVHVDGADVTLSGTVHSWSERDLATHSAWGSPGVRHVKDQMTIAY